MIQKSVAIDKFLGLVNRNDSSVIGALTQAQNIDYFNDGSIERRDGYTQSFALTNCTSSYVSPAHNCAYSISSAGLMKHDGTTNVVLDATVPNGRYVWCSSEANIYLIGNGAKRCIEPSGRVFSTAILAPSNILISACAGSLAAGTYQVCCTTRDAATGLESAASAVTTIVVPANSGIQVSGPANQVVYCSTHNGSVLYKAGAGETVVITSEAGLAAPIDVFQLGATGIPDGVAAGTYFNGRLYLGVDNFLLFSRPFWPHIFAPHEDFIPLASKVLGVESVQSGVVIGCENSIHLYSLDGNLSTLASYGVIAGRPMARDKNGKVWIWTRAGLCSFDTQFVEVNKPLYAPDPGTVCSVNITDFKGDPRVVVLTDGAAASILSTY